MPNPICPSCTEEGLRPSNSSHNKILLVGDVPSDEDMSKGQPFSDGAGIILRKELFIAGIDSTKCRITNLWVHVPNKNKNCFQVGYEQVLEEAKEKEAILLFGTECVKTFTAYKINDITGLVLESQDHVFSAPIVMFSITPKSVFHSGVGEIRFALKNFSQELSKRGLL